MRMQQLYELVDVEKTAQQMGEKLTARIQRDRTIADDTTPQTVIQYVRDEIDPTDNQQYTLWILRTYIKGGIRFYEDMSRVNSALKFFHTNKQSMDIKDINQIKMLTQLEQMVSTTQPVGPSNKELKREQLEQIKSETKVFYSGPEGKILIPETEEASCFWGQGTQWCTAAKTSMNYFDHYNRQGPLYIILTNDGTKWQLHPESNQFLDAQDEKFDIEEWSDNYPWAFDILSKVYPQMMPLWMLKDRVSEDKWKREVLDRGTEAAIPRIDGIEGNNVRLDYWRNLQELLDEADIHSFSTEPNEFDDTETDIHTTPSFDKLLLSRLGKNTRIALEEHFHVHTDEAVSAVVMEQIDALQPIYDVITNHFDSPSDDKPSDYQVAEAATTIIHNTLDEYDAFFKVHDDGSIGLYMNINEFANKLDEENAEYPEETFAYHSYNWITSEQTNMSFDDIVDNDGGEYFQHEVSIINRVKGREFTDVVTITAVQDHDTPDMFGNTETDDTVEIPVAVIDQVVRNIRNSLQIYETRSFKTILNLLLESA